MTMTISAGPMIRLAGICLLLAVPAGSHAESTDVQDAEFFGETFTVKRNTEEEFKPRITVRYRDAKEISGIEAAKTTLTKLLRRLHAPQGKPAIDLLTDASRKRLAGHLEYIRNSVASKPVLRYRITYYKLDHEKGVLSFNLMLWHRIQGFDLPKGRTANFEQQPDGRWLVKDLGHIEWP